MKWLAGLLAFLVPGLGHFYLGLMVKGIAVMLLIAADISAIVYSAIYLDNVLLIVLLSLLLPILYFYSLFDAIQSTDTVNDRRARSAPGYPPYGMPAGSRPPAPLPVQPLPVVNPEPPSPVEQTPADSHERPDGHPEAGRGGLPDSFPYSGILLLAAGIFLLVLTTDNGWARRMIHPKGSFVGAALLIGAGIAVWFWEKRGQIGRRD